MEWPWTASEKQFFQKRVKQYSKYKTNKYDYKMKLIMSKRIYRPRNKESELLEACQV